MKRKGIKLEYPTYEPFHQKKGVCEAAIKGIKDGQLYWTVWETKGIGYDTLSQDTAEILCEVYAIRKMLKKRQ